MSLIISLICNETKRTKNFKRYCTVWVFVVDKFVAVYLDHNIRNISPRCTLVNKINIYVVEKYKKQYAVLGKDYNELLIGNLFTHWIIYLQINISTELNKYSWHGCEDFNGKTNLDQLRRLWPITSMNEIMYTVFYISVTQM